ncbi:unnamed protein product [Ectocarpus sp. 6 AP-2014]
MSTSARLSQAMALAVALVSTPRAVSFVGVGSMARIRNIGFESRAADRLHGVSERAVRSGVATGRRRRDSRSLAMATVDEEEAIRAAALANVVTGTPQVLVADGLTNTFDGARFQFEDLQLTVCRGQKLGLVGINGCGKSTLLKVLGKKESCDSGTIESPKATVVTYVEQDPEFPTGSTVKDAVYGADNPLMRAVRAYQLATEAIEGAGADPDTLEKAMDRFEKATATMDRVGGWDVETYAQQVMSRLGVMSLEGSQVVNLSGGQRKRVALAAALVQKPDVLLLDEPTNHLDVEAIEWLEKLLAERSLTFVCVTHDRYFLENVCQEIIELDTAKLYRYPGSYERFLELKEERMNAEGAARDRARNKLRGELAWMRKQPKARQAKSKAREERFYELKTKAAAPAGASDKGLTLSSKTQRLGKTVVYLKGASLKFSAKILDNFAYEFDRGDRIGIVGGNGVGKTTFLNVLMGKQLLDTGEVVTGGTVRYGYYEQGGLVDMDDDVRVMELVEDTCAGAEVGEDEEPVPPQVQARRLLNLFQFPAARWNDRVGRLSGGEKRRLQLLKVLATNPNFLVLDEPTNDLDILSLQILEDFLLNDYKGCLVIVSHDRFFVDKVAKHLFLFEGDGVVRDFQGTFTEYLDYRQDFMKPGAGGVGGSKAAAVKLDAEEAAQNKGSSQAVDAPTPSTPAPQQKAKKMSNKQRFEFSNLEKDIESLGERGRELDALLAAEAENPSAGYDEIAAWMEEQARIEVETESKTERWLELADLE